MTIYLIDYENVHDAGLRNSEKIPEDSKILLFFSNNDDKITMGNLMPIVSRLTLYRTRAGKQSLDMHLASYLGHEIGINGKEHKYVIVSKDHDYDNVTLYWKDQGLDVSVQGSLVPESAETIAEKKETTVPRPANTARRTQNSRFLPHSANRPQKQPVPAEETQIQTETAVSQSTIKPEIQTGNKTEVRIESKPVAESVDDKTMATASKTAVLPENKPVEVQLQEPEASAVKADTAAAEIPAEKPEISEEKDETRTEKEPVPVQAETTEAKQEEQKPVAVKNPEAERPVNSRRPNSRNRRKNNAAVKADSEAPAAQGKETQETKKPNAVNPAQTAKEEAPVQKAAAQQPVKEAPVQKAAAQQPVKEAPAQKAAVQQPVKEAHVQKAAAQQPVKEVPAQKAVTAPNPVKEIKPAKETPAQKAPVQQQQTEKTLLNNKMMAKLTEAKLDAATVGKLTATIMKQYGKQNFKQIAYREIIKACGMQQGLEVYGLVKKIL